jgi:hypothetical protein
MNITLEINVSDRADVQAARALLDNLLMDDIEAETLESAETVVVIDLDALWPNLGDNAKRLLWFAAQSFGPNEEFTFEDLAPKMGLSVDSVKAIHRNLSRAMRVRGMHVYDVLPARWGGERQHYHLTQPTHDMLRSLDLS